MNINAIQKHYDKLTVKERFAALVAAGMRGDDQEREALLRSAPRKTFSVPHTYGLSEAFISLSMWHVIDQLGYAVTFYFLIFNDEIESDIQIEGFDFNDIMILLQRRILTGREAWRAICKEYGVDPEKMLEALPYTEMIDLVELIVRAANHDAPLELTDLQETIDGLRAVIETKRKEWE
jgi:hypothetical protein